MGPWGERVVPHEVTEGDTLGLLALHYYDDPLKWELITLFNGLTPTDVIQDGDVLLIPEPLEQPVVIPEGQRPMGGTYRHRGGPRRNIDMM
jgi:hypothetical protein